VQERSGPWYQAFMERSGVVMLGEISKSAQVLLNFLGRRASPGAPYAMECEAQYCLPLPFLSLPMTVPVAVGCVGRPPVESGMGGAVPGRRDALCLLNSLGRRPGHSTLVDGLRYAAAHAAEKALQQQRQQREAAFGAPPRSVPSHVRRAPGTPTCSPWALGLSLSLPTVTGQVNPYAGFLQGAAGRGALLHPQRPAACVQ